MAEPSCRIWTIGKIKGSKDYLAKMMGYDAQWQIPDPESYTGLHVPSAMMLFGLRYIPFGLCHCSDL